MLLTLQGFFENGQFVSSESVQKLPERKRAILTILDDEEKENQAAEMNELFRLLDESMDEEVPEFPRANLHREVDI
ncbi:hypothetical protein ACYULU_10285 [Breznakiellaceae bacterium SP9]